ncbi:MAG: ABC transporter permease, partial [Haloferacaceae archaeon]
MNRDYAVQLASAGAFLLAWQLAVGSFQLVPSSVLPAPAAIAVDTAALATDGRFLEHVAATLRRTVVASFFAAGVGIPLGLAMGWNDALKALLAPLFAALYPLPVGALLPLLLLLFGRGDAALVFTAAFGGFFLVLWNAMNAAGGIEAVYVDVARD